MMNFIITDYNAGQEQIKGGGEYKPDYDGCIKISTDASLRMMIAPGALVLGSPLLAGFLFGPDAVAGLLAGAIVSGVQVAISASNTGGAWDNCKKEIEKNRAGIRKEVAQFLQRNNIRKEDWDTYKNSDPQDEDTIDLIKREKAIREKHVAAVVGDTVGDPLKDTSGPAINILIKLSAITSLVFGNYVKEYNLAALLAKPAADAPAATAAPAAPAAASS
jgi:inorganic pyrophosphatase